MHLRILLLASLLIGSTGCLVRSGPGHHQSKKSSKSCGPAHHWDGHACVHNGKGKHKGDRK